MRATGAVPVLVRAARGGLSRLEDAGIGTFSAWRALPWGLLGIARMAGPQKETKNASPFIRPWLSTLHGVGQQGGRRLALLGEPLKKYCARPGVVEMSPAAGPV